MSNRPTYTTNIWKDFEEGQSRLKDDEKMTDEVKSTADYIEIFLTGNQWYFHPRSKNNENLAQSEGYDSKDSVVRAARGLFPSVAIFYKDPSNGKREQL